MFRVWLVCGVVFIEIVGRSSGFLKTLKTMSKRKSTVDSMASKHPKISNHWSMGLLKSMEDPKVVVKSDDLVAVIKDAYPKAEFHYLVIPKENISSLKSVKKEHLHLLKHMDKLGREVISNDKHKDKTFKLGYHSEASMFRLHLHVISDDMNSPCLKTKKHWNSFTSNFFLDSEDVIKSLENDGKVKLPSAESCKNFMGLPLKCHKCDFKPKNIPDLKKHILTHLN